MELVPKNILTLVEVAMLLHVDLFVQSIEKMLDFYVGILGMELVDDSIISGGLVNFVSQGAYTSYRIVLLRDKIMGTMLELVQYLEKPPKNTQYSQDTHTTLTFLVPSLEEQINKLSKKNIYPASNKFLVTMPKVGTSKLIFYRDPEEHLVEFLEMVK